MSFTQVKRQVEATLVLSFSNGEKIECTKEHPFYVEHKGFTPAGELGIGTSIVTRAGPSAKLAHVEVKDAQATVYNFEVEDFHSYFVGIHDGGLWVHNKCWAAHLTPGEDGGVKPGNFLTFKQALDRIRRGLDVITDSRSEAKSLAKTASGNGSFNGPEIHGGVNDGYFWHFHPDPRTGSHIFYP